MSLSKFGIVIGIFISAAASAEEADPVAETQALLRSPKARTHIIQGDAKAQKVEAHIKKMGLSPEGQSAVYDLTADILKTLAEQNGGDSAQLAERMQGYLKDPASIEKDLTPEQKKRIHELSLQTPQGQPSQLDSSIRP